MSSFHDGARIAITGRAVLTPLADSPDALHAALSEGRSAMTASTAAGGVGVTEIKDFDHAKYAAVRGMRMYNKTTRMAICAAKLALDDAKITPGTTYAGDDLGVLMASTYGHIDVLCEYDRSLVTNGIQRTNGALMPFVIPSAPGAMVGLSFGLKAFSMTFSDGGASALDALAMGARWLADGRAKACVVVASFAPFADLVLAAARDGMLAQADQIRAFDARGTGTALGEAAVAFVLERAEDAKARGAESHGQLRGYGTSFARAKSGGVAGALRRASVDALRAAGAKAGDVALASASGSGVADADRAESEALAAVFKERGAPVPVTALKGALGDTIDVAGALQTLIALSSLAKKTAPPVARLGEVESNPSLDYLRAAGPVRGHLALVTSASRAGSCSALVLSDGNEGTA